MLPFWVSIGFLSLVQGILLVIPRAPMATPLLARFQGRWWALILPLSIVVVIGGIALDSASARFLTWLALIAVPPLAAIALGWIVHGGRPWFALAAVPLFAIAWAAKGELGGQSCALALSALACVTLGWLLVCVVLARWVKFGIYAMATVDAYLVFTELLQEPNSVLNAPPACDRTIQLRGAILAGFLCCAWDLLFFAIKTTPATVPVPLSLLTLELWGRWGPVRSESRTA